MKQRFTIEEIVYRQTYRVSRTVSVIVYTSSKVPQ